MRISLNKFNAFFERKMFFMLKKFSSILFVVTFIINFFFNSLIENFAEAATRASFSDTNAYCNVKINDSLISKKGRQYATVKLKVFSILNGGGIGLSNHAKVQIRMTDEYGNHIWSGIKSGGTTLKLGDDHRVYRIYVKPYYEGGNNPDIIQQGINFNNAGKCVTWEFTNAKGCSIS